MLKYKKSVCSGFKPINDVFSSGSHSDSKCSHCIYFNSKNCHRSAMDNIEFDDEL